MRKLSIGRVLYRIRRSSGLGLISNFSFNNKQVSSSTLDEVVEYKKPLLIASTTGSCHLVKLKDVTSGGPRTLALHSKPPKEVVLKVSMHCNGCARKVKKHVLKMEGVISCKIDMETKTVVVTGDIIPLQVLESLSKVKTAQLWDTQTDSLNPN